MATIHVSVSEQEVLLLDGIVSALGKSRSGLMGRYLRDGLAADYELLGKIEERNKLKSQGFISTVMSVEGQTEQAIALLEKAGYKIEPPSPDA